MFGVSRTSVGGATGEEGRRGERGGIGPPGAEGVRGTDGEAGVCGKTGATGAIGEPGPPGEEGAEGPAGLRGGAGMHGAMGPPGPPGEVRASTHYCFIAQDPRWPAIETVIEDDEGICHYENVTEWQHPLGTTTTHFNQATGVFHCGEDGYYEFQANYAFSTEDFSTVPNTVSLLLVRRGASFETKHAEEEVLHACMSPQFQAPTLVRCHFTKQLASLRAGDQVMLRLSGSSDLLMARVRHDENQFCGRHRGPLLPPPI